MEKPLLLADFFNVWRHRDLTLYFILFYLLIRKINLNYLKMHITHINIVYDASQDAKTTQSTKWINLKYEINPKRPLAF